FVDEASMISNAPTENGMYENSSLFDDLLSYVYSGVNCKLILIGDTAQLPPVNLDMSPALEEDNTSFFGLDIGHIELDEVMRQEEGSGILHNATQIKIGRAHV